MKPIPEASPETRSRWSWLVEPARPRRIAAWENAHWLVVGTVCIGAFMGQLDASIVSLALPTLHRQFAITIGAVEWVALAYLLTLVSTVIAVGRLADMAGRKLLYTYGFIVFIAGSAACGLAPSFAVLVGARVFQALGAAMLQANSVAIIVQAVPRGKLGRSIGVQGAAQAVGLALGPAVGGLLVTAGGWRLIFFINIPMGIAGTILGWFLIPRSRHLQAAQPFDWLGAALFSPAIAAPVAAVSLGSDYGWNSPIILGLFAIGILFAGSFLWRETHAASPMIDLGLFRRIPFSAGIGSGLLSYLALFGILFIVPFYLEIKRGFSAADSGLLLTALPAALAVTAPLAGKLSDRLGARPVTVSGMLITALGLLAMAMVRRPEAALLAELALIGVGLGAFTPANNAAIMGSAPLNQTGL
ncbi:MAG: MFS transporter, partial [Chloroflexota bacterium]